MWNPIFQEYNKKNSKKWSPLHLKITEWGSNYVQDYILHYLRRSHGFQITTPEFIPKKYPTTPPEGRAGNSALEGSLFHTSTPNLDNFEHAQNVIIHQVLTDYVRQVYIYIYNYYPPSRVRSAVSLNRLNLIPARGILPYV